MAENVVDVKAWKHFLFLFLITFSHYHIIFPLQIYFIIILFYLYRLILLYYPGGGTKMELLLLKGT